MRGKEEPGNGGNKERRNKGRNDRKREGKTRKRTEETNCGSYKMDKRKNEITKEARQKERKKTIKKCEGKK